LDTRWMVSAKSCRTLNVVFPKYYIIKILLAKFKPKTTIQKENI